MVAFLFGGAAAAQVEPPVAKPAPQTARPWTADEAAALDWCLQLRRWGQRPYVAVEQLPRYRFVEAAIGADGARFGGVASGTGREEHAIVYVVPADRGDARTQRAFCLRADGAVAWTDNAAGTAAEGGRAPCPDDVLAAGGGGTVLDFPRTPQRGRDGNLWLPADVVASATVRVHVVDEDNAPLGRVTVVSAPAEDPRRAVDAVIPAGHTATYLEGDGVLTGPAARGLAFTVVVDGLALPVPPAAAQVTATTARLTVPRRELLRVRVNRNEWQAVAMLKRISSAQSQCQAMGVIDGNRNGTGEYGTLAELTGAVIVRGGTEPIEPRVLTPELAKVEHGMAVHQGYCFAVFLPAAGGGAVPELPAGGGDAARIDPALAERCWCAYAWPLEAGITGQAAFFVDHHGDVLRAPDAASRYSGVEKAPPPDAARRAATAGRMDDPPAANVQARDGQTWVVMG